MGERVRLAVHFNSSGGDPCLRASFVVEVRLYGFGNCTPPRGRNGRVDPGEAVSQKIGGKKAIQIGM